MSGAPKTCRDRHADCFAFVLVQPARVAGSCPVSAGCGSAARLEELQVPARRVLLQTAGGSA